VCGNNIITNSKIYAEDLLCENNYEIAKNELYVKRMDNMKIHTYRFHFEGTRHNYIMTKFSVCIATNMPTQNYKELFRELHFVKTENIVL